MHPALLVVFALSAQPAPVTSPSEPAAAPASEAPPVDATPGETPPSTPAPEATTKPAPEPAPAVAPAATAKPPDPHAPAPAVGATESTWKNAKLGDETDVARSKYKIGKGFTVASKDGRFSLQIRGRMQFRYDIEHPNLPDTQTHQILQVRRMRLLLQGTVFSPYIKYHFQFGFSPRDMVNDLPNEEGSVRRNPLRDARIEFDRLRDFTVWVGQFKVPFSRQRMLSSSNMNLVDRSAVNAEFNLDRDIGIQAMSKDVGGLGNRLAYYAGVFIGEGRNNYAVSDFGMLYVGRVEVLPFGKFDDYVEGDIGRSKTPGLSIGGAYAFQDRAHVARGVVGDYPADRGTTDFHHVNADIMFKWHGVTLQTALHWRKGFNRRSGGATDEMGDPIALEAARSGLGWYGQLGWVVPKIPLEIVGRYSLIRNTFGAASSLRDADEAGGGINYYFVGHDLKLQLDYFRLWDQSMGASPAERAANGLDRVRLQLQVYF